MKLKLKRYSDDGDSTLGLFYIDGKFSCYTLEDERRDVKVPGETRIPSGTYKVVYQENRTPMTIRYKNKYTFFTKHLMLVGVKGFSSIYIHSGNTDKHTDGCILLADSCISNVTREGFVGNSRDAYKRNYGIITQALDNNEDIFLKVEDEDVSN